ncbi:MAG TPA: hypothetical protein VET88_04470 [Gammaproteobacteria bacterium]|nr:hypothetical protein [Gammaproteobacteria bacterium]
MMTTTREETVMQVSPKLDSLRLGVDREAIRLAGSEDVQVVTAMLASKTRRTLLLHTYDLEARIYDRLPFIDAVSALVRRYPGACFDVLIQNVERVVKDGHRLVELARRLGSSVQIRRCAQQYQGYCGTFMLADDSGYLYRPNSSRFEGQASFNNTAEVARLGKYFREVWEHSGPEMELRRLYV